MTKEQGAAGYPHGGDIYRNQRIRLDFSVNTNPFGMPQKIRMAAAASAGCWEQYPDCLARSLRQSMAEYYGGKIAAEQIICGNGASDLLYTLMFAQRPKKALIPIPSFAEYELALRAAGCESEKFYLDEAAGFRQGEGGEVFLRHIRDSFGIDMVIIGNPNNPTGMAADKGWLKELAGICREKGIFLVADECFNWFLKDREQFSFIPLMQEQPERYGHVCVLNAFTKIYAMAGLRFGYAICTDREVLAKMEGCRQPWSVSAPAEAAAKAALSEKDWIQKTVETVENEREFLTAGLKRLKFAVFPSMVNFILFKTNRPVDYKKLCMDRGILIRSCENFDGLYRGYYRVSVRTRRENEELLRCLEEAGG